jgi:AraC-like DNA-binding protein
VSVVAFAVGFRDLTTFERAFKKHEGMTPREFRKQALVPRREVPPEAAGGRFMNARTT